MIKPSKRHVAVDEARAEVERKREELREAARSGRGAKARAEELAAAEIALAEAEASPDVYTCIECGKDFGDGPHVDLLVGAILVFGADGVKETRDYGLSKNDSPARRVKICGPCSSKWAIPILEYVEIR